MASEAPAAASAVEKATEDAPLATAPVEVEPDQSSKLRTFLGILRK
jgi:hypothetical protein